MTTVKLMTLDPGHFHAALIQKEMYPGIDRRATVYAPLGPDLVEHLNRVARFNVRKENPTAWELDVHTGGDPLERMLREHPGNVVVLSGRNRSKIDRIQASIQAGLHVLADKPWIIQPEDLPKLESSLNEAERRGVVAYDIMTERFEITSIVQRELVNDAAVFGRPVDVYMRSVHHIFKLVAGVPNLRPAWFFDIHEQGEALSDVGTHLVDLVQWTLYPDKPVDYRTDIVLNGAERWPTKITPAHFQQVTGETRADALDYYCNTRVFYSFRGIPVKLDVVWNYEAPAGTGDTHFAVYHGNRSRVEVRQGKEENYRPEVYVVPEHDPAIPALKKRVALLAKRFPGVALHDRGKEALIHIPDEFRVGHEAHFAQVANQFLKFLENPKLLPAWEKPNMLAKYYVTTKGVELSRSPGVRG